jgi:hypothetical protein
MTVAHTWNIDRTWNESLVRNSECGYVEQIEPGSYAGRRDALSNQPSGGVGVGDVETPPPSVVNVEREATRGGDKASGQAMVAP